MPIIGNVYWYRRQMLFDNKMMNEVEWKSWNIEQL